MNNMIDTEEKIFATILIVSLFWFILGAFGFFEWLCAPCPALVSVVK